MTVEDKQKGLTVVETGEYRSENGQDPMDREAWLWCLFDTYFSRSDTPADIKEFFAEGE